MAENAGLKVVMPVSSIINSTTLTSATVEKMAQVLSELIDTYPAFGGVHGRDEANATKFGLITEANDKYKQAVKDINAEDLLIFWNAAGYGPASIYYSGEEDVFMNYDEYLDLYVGLKPKYISSATYIFYHDTKLYGNVHYNYFMALSAIKNKADSAGIPYWFHTQNGGYFNDMEYSKKGVRMPNEQEYQWNMNTVLAYGAKGLILFPLCHPVEWIDDRYDTNSKGLFDPSGNKNSFWYYMRNMSLQLKSIGEYIMNSANVGLISHGNSPVVVPEIDLLGNSWRELKKVSGGDALIGCFDYKGKTALYVVNNSITQSSEVFLEFDEKYGYDIIQRGQTISVAAKKIPLKLNAGEGVMVVLK